MAGNTFTWFGGSGSAGDTSNWTPTGGPPNTGDTGIVTSGTVIMPGDAQLNSNTLAIGSATVSFTGDRALNFNMPTLDGNTLVTNVVAGVSGAESTVLDSAGIFINQGSIQAGAAAGSSFTLNVTTNGTVPGYFINYNDMEVDAGNSMTIAVGASSEFFNVGEIVVSGGTLLIDASSSAIAGGYAPVGGAIVISGGGAVETNAAYASNISGAAPYYAFADSTAGNTLKIDNYASFGGNILGFGVGDTIDLGTLIAGASQAVFSSSSGILKVENAGGTILASLLLAGSNFSGNVSVGTGTDGDTVLTTTVQNDIYNNTSGTWQDASGWSNGTPGSLDTAFIGLGAKSAFTLTTGTTPVQVGALQLVDQNALLQITSNTTAGPSPINVLGGTLEVKGGNTLTATALRGSGGAVEVDQNAVLDLTGHVITSSVGAVNGTLAVVNSNTSALRLYGGTLVVDGGTLVAGPGQTGGNGGAIQIGYDGSGTPATLTVQNNGTSAGVVTDTYAIVSSDPTSSGVLTLDGSNVTWTDEIDPNDSTKRGYMMVGYNNEAGNSGTISPPSFSNTATLLVENGATLVEQNAATIAATADSSGSATIETGGLWNIAATGSFTTGNLSVGASAEGSLSVLGSGGTGGTVEVGTGGIGIGGVSSASGTIVVSGSGALLATTGGINDGIDGLGLLEALNGGTIELGGTKGITVGASGGVGGTLIVGGTDTVNGASALLSIGSSGKGISVGGASNGTVEITSGGTFDMNGTGGIGLGTVAAVTGVITVVGPNALLSVGTAATGFGVGAAGNGTLAVSGGGAVTIAAKGLSIGTTNTGNGVVTVSGSGSSITTQGTSGIFVGSPGTGALTINGGTVTTSSGILIATGGSATSNGTVTVEGGGTLNAGAQVAVGQSGNGSLIVENGGAVSITASGMVIGSSTTGVGTVTVLSGSSITTLGTNSGISVGSPGTGVLTINGGTVTAGSGVVIAGGTTTTGNGTVIVEGGGTLSSAAQITVGQNGAGTLIVAGGSVFSTGTFHGFSIGNYFAGTVTSVGNGFVSITNGTVNEAGTSGSFQVGQTNDASGILQLGVGGTLITTGIFASIDSNNGGSAVATVSDGTWTAGQLNIGVNGTGSLDVNSNGLVNAGTSFISLGQNVGSDGIVTVESGGTLTTSGGLTVGSSGTGLLTISSGGSVSNTGTNSSINIGFNANSSGTIDVNGGALTTSGGNIAVGQFGTGALDVSGGGAVTIGANGLAIGFDNTGVGTVVVSGSSSSITTLGTSGVISVGSPGTGVLTIDGGTVASSNGVVIAAGATTTSNGTVTVEGGGTLNAIGQFDVGENGTGTLIVAGGSVSSTGTFHGFAIGAFSGSNGFVSITNGTLVDNAGTLGGSFQVGQTNDASGTLNIGVGGTLITTGVFASIDSNNGGSAVATVSGGTWTAGQLTVGVNGTGSLDVNSKGLVNAGTNFVTLGQNAGSDGIVTVESGGTLTAAGGFSVGNSGSGMLTVSGGGLVSNTGQTSVNVGFNPNSSGTIEINGGTLTDSAGGGFSIGGSNATGMVTVEGGGLLKTGGTLAFSDINAMGTGVASAIVSGGTWTSAGSIIVGDTGTGSLDINSNGVVNAGSHSILIGNQSGGAGTLSLESGGMLQAGFVSLDNNNAGTGSLIVAGGTATLASIQENGNSTITVGSGSLSVSGNAVIGQSGTGAALNITGGTATTGALTLGFGTGASGSASVSNALLTVNGQLGIGTPGTGIATVNSGGSISADGVLVGSGGGSAGTGTLIINGGSVSEVGNMQIGTGGSAFVTVEAGGAFTATNSTGFSFAIGISNGGTAAVVVNDGVFSTSGKPLSIGNGGNASVLVENGGSFITTFSGGGPGIDINATGTAQASVTVTANSSFTLNDTNGQLVVGDAGSGSLTIGSGGLVNASGNAVDIANQNGGQGTVTVNGGTLMANSVVIAGGSGASGTLAVGGGGLVQAGSVTAGSGATISLAGGIVDPTTAIQVNTGGVVSGFGTLAASVVDDSMVASSGGTLEITGIVTGFGTLALDTGSTLLLDSQPGSNPSVSFNSGSPETLIIGAPSIAASTTGGNFAGVLSVAVGDRIELGSGIVINGVSLVANGSTNADIAVTQSGTSGFYVLNNVTFSGVADSFTIGTDGTTGDDYIQAVQAPCFIAGTRITTERGEVAVEELAVGDRLQVVGTSPSSQASPASGGTGQPIVWIGHRTVDCARHPQPSKVWPVRVSAGAFGPGRPYRDLWLSPDHALLVDDVLIPVKYLINGTTIAQIQVDEVTYYHVKLARHDVILAEGLPAESYLDAGDRSNFANGGGPIALYPDFSSRIWDAEGCAPLVVTGPKLDAARHWVNGLAGRAIRAA